MTNDNAYLVLDSMDKLFEVVIDSGEKLKLLLTGDQVHARGRAGDPDKLTRGRDDTTRLNRLVQHSIRGSSSESGSSRNLVNRVGAATRNLSSINTELIWKDAIYKLSN